MRIFIRGVLLLKVLVLLSLGSSAAWAECPDHGEQASAGQGVHSTLMIAKSESTPADQGQGDSEDEDDTMTDDEGDSQT